MRGFIIIAAVLVALTSTGTGGFAPSATNTMHKSKLDMGMFDEMFTQAFHGHGSGRGHEDEIYQEEQAVLKDRKKRHLIKEDLKEKYNPHKEKWLEKMMHAFHGHGSGEDKLDEMYKAQQQVLYERREYFGNKAMLKKKYRDYRVDHHNEIKTINDDPALLNKKEDDAMYIDEESPQWTFPWQKLKP